MTASTPATPDHTCEICELATELAEERMAHQRTAAELAATRQALERIAKYPSWQAEIARAVLACEDTT